MEHPTTPTPIPEGKVECPWCHEIVRPDRVDTHGVCVNCLALNSSIAPPRIGGEAA